MGMKPSRLREGLKSKSRHFNNTSLAEIANKLEYLKSKGFDFTNLLGKTENGFVKSVDVPLTDGEIASYIDRYASSPMATKRTYNNIKMDFLPYTDHKGWEGAFAKSVMNGPVESWRKKATIYPDGNVTFKLCGPEDRTDSRTTECLEGVVVPSKRNDGAYEAPVARYHERSWSDSESPLDIRADFDPRNYYGHGKFETPFARNVKHSDRGTVMGKMVNDYKKDSKGNFVYDENDHLIRLPDAPMTVDLRSGVIPKHLVKDYKTKDGLSNKRYMPAVSAVEKVSSVPKTGLDVGINSPDFAQYRNMSRGNYDIVPNGGNFGYHSRVPSESWFKAHPEIKRGDVLSRQRDILKSGAEEGYSTLQKKADDNRSKGVVSKYNEEANDLLKTKAALTDSISVFKNRLKTVEDLFNSKEKKLMSDYNKSAKYSHVNSYNLPKHVESYETPKGEPLTMEEAQKRIKELQDFINKQKMLEEEAKKLQ